MNNVARNFRVAWAAVFLLALAACSIGPSESRAPTTYLLDPQIAFKTSPANPNWSASATLACKPAETTSGLRYGAHGLSPTPP